MKSIFFIVFVILVALSSSLIFSQEIKDSANFNPMSLGSFPNLHYYSGEFISDQENSILNFDSPLSADTSAIWLWTSAVLSNQNKRGYRFSESSPHMLANFHQIYIENSKFNIVRTVLGAAQLGAVGYLAYKHIKKYGFLK